ncbi:hypothetical protein ACFPYJ_11010 [Paenibacillus solisilvae]|uniref:ParA family protein n=1 Tax=Paenibacillus solisilvae TaxID=2486751 RepID=A0ABW0VVL7_9BACL
MTGRQVPIIAFVGTTPNIGTTAAAFAAACRIAEEGVNSVGYLCLNLKSSKIHRYIGVDAPEATLDSLRPELKTGSLYPDKLLRSMHQVRGTSQLRILFGNTIRDQAEYFTVEEMNHLLDIAQQSFDVVIADVSAYWDNAATLCALRRADFRIVVTTSALSHFQEDAQRWLKQLSPVFGIANGDYEAVIIHPPWRNGGFQVKDICKELGIPFIGQLRLSEELLSQLDSGMLDDWLTQGEQGKQVMTEPARHFIRKHGLQRRVEIRVQPWYKKLLTHRGEVGS